MRTIKTVFENPKASKLILKKSLNVGHGFENGQLVWNKQDDVADALDKF